MALLNLWLSRIPETDVELRLKIVDRIIKIHELQRKIDASKKGRGGKFTQRPVTRG